MKIIWIFIAGVIFMNLIGCGESSTVVDTEKLRHLVLFKFKDDANGDQVRAIEDSFRSLPGKVPEIIDFEWGLNISQEGKSQGFTHCFLVTFEDEVGRGVYLPHPEHKAFVELLGPSLDKVLVVDYITKNTTLPSTFKSDGKLRHVVLFKWKDDTSPEQVLTNQKAFASLPRQINTIKAFEWGVDCSIEGLSNGFTQCFLLTFDDNAGIETYLPHPAHKEFGGVIGASKEKVLVFDYVASK